MWLKTTSMMTSMPLEWQALTISLNSRITARPEELPLLGFFWPLGAAAAAADEKRAIGAKNPTVEYPQ